MDDDNRYYPFVLTLFIEVADQLTKFLVVETIPLGEIAFSYWNNFLWICHVRNTGAAFSFGDSFKPEIRLLVFIVLPLLVLFFLCSLIVQRKSGLSNFQRWIIAGIVGGGLGTITDRVFRFHEGVVDFISVKFYGLFGMDRFPTFNVSDSCVVIFVILFALSILFSRKKNDPNERNRDSEYQEL